MYVPHILINAHLIGNAPYHLQFRNQSAAVNSRGPLHCHRGEILVSAREPYQAGAQLTINVT